MSKLPSLVTIINEYRGRDLIISLLLKTLKIIIILASIVFILKGISYLPLSEIALEIENYGNFTIAFLTLCLVLTTTFYAVTTYKMLRQMKDTKRLEIQPLLWIKLDQPVFKDFPNDNNLRDFILPNIYIANYGKGAAVSIRINYIVQFGWSEQLNGIEYTGTTHGNEENIPVILPPNNSFQDSVILTTLCYDLEKYKVNFLRIRILYEDIERNLYKINQDFSLNTYSMSETEKKYSLKLKKEELIFIAFANRKYVGDLEQDLRSSNEDENNIIYSRRSLMR